MTAPPLQLTIDARAAQRVAGSLGPAMAGVLSALMFDLMDHHRRSVLKGVKARFPGGLGAQQMVAAGLHRYGRKVQQPIRPSQVEGGSFAAAGSGGFYGDDFFSLLERGGVARSSQQMAVPFLFGPGGTPLKGAARQTALRRFLLGLRQKEYAVVGKGWLVRKVFGNRAYKVTRLAGVLRRSRKVKPMLGFQEAFDRIQGQHLKAFDQGLALMVEAAERGGKGTPEAGTPGQRTALTVLRRARAEGLTDADARKVARIAGRMAKGLAVAKV